MRVGYTFPALADLGSIVKHIAAHSTQGPQRVQAPIRAVIELLSFNPNIGARTDDPAIRPLPTQPYPHLVFYEVAEAEIITHAVRHAARDPSEMPGAP